MISHQFDNIFLSVTIKNVQVGFGSGIDWPHGSGSAIQDNELKDPDPKEIIKDPQH
jgi:hypothetical protein